MYNYIINGFNIILLFLLVFFQLNKVQAQITPAGATNNELATIKLTAIADTFVVRSERETVFNLLTNDKMGYSPEVHRIKIVAEPKNGKAKVIQEKGVDKIAYTYAAQDERGDEFVYEICDPKKDCSQATILVVKCPPVAGGFPQAEEVFIRKGQSHTASFEKHIIRATPNRKFPMQGKITMSADSSVITYQPADGFMGADRLDFSVYENKGPVCGYHHVVSKNLYIYVLPEDGENKAPVAVTDEITIIGMRKTEVKVLENDYDPEKCLKPRIMSVTTPKNGKAKYSNTEITYTPNKGFTGKDEMTYEICDYNGACTKGKVIFTVKKSGSK